MRLERERERPARGRFRPDQLQHRDRSAGGMARCAHGIGRHAALPAGLAPIHGDSGTASAALLGPDGTIRAYLNATPADPNEHIAGWARFRVNHNADEEHHNVRLISSRAGVTIGSERGSCVTDQYATSRTTYRELACLVAPTGGGARTVLVAATQPSAWAQEHSMLMFALDHFAS